MSHDLRTPLARLRFGLDVLADDIHDINAQATLEHLNRDLWDMELLVETLLEYGKLEEANIHLKLIPLNLVELIRELITASYRDEVQLDITGLQHILIPCHAEYMAMLLNNILQNALRYGKGQVYVQLMQSSTQLEIYVEDNGPGIPEDELQKVLIPFYRAANTSAIKGHGMGLALVERIVHWHGGRLMLERSARLGGLGVRVVFSV